MVLDFSDVESVPHQIRTGLRLRKPDFDFASAVAQRDELTATRAQLDSFVTDLHQVNPDWGYSVHDLLEKLARLTAQVDAPTTRVRFTADTLAAIKIAGEDEVLQLLNRGAEIGIFSAEVAKSAWSNSSITDLQVGASAVARARRLHEVILPAVRAQVARSAGETGLHPAQTPNQWFEQIDMFDGISQSLDFFLPKIFESSVEHLIALTASKEWRSEHQISLSLSQKRMYRRELADLLRPGAVPADIHRELVLVEERREIWKRYTKDAGWPTLPSGMLQIQASRKVLASELTQLAAEVGGFGYLDIDFVKTSKIVEELVKDAAQMVQLPALNEVRGQLKRLGIEHFVADLRERNVTRDQLSQEFELAVTSSIFEQLLRKSKLLAALGPRDLLALVEKFRKLDLAQVNSLSGPVQLAAINNMRAYARAHRNDTIHLDQLLAKYGVGILRDVIATYPRLVQLARPIWIVPPVIARDYIPQMHWVDLVLCDTTERTELAAIIPSLLRGRQLVIVGDKRRNELIDVNALPADSHDASAAAQVADGDIDLADLGQARAFPSFAKIFPVLQLPTLRVQYDEKSARALLAHGYQDAYLPIPESPMKRSAQLISVDGRGVPSANGDGAVESTAAEVDAVVDLILNYALDQNPQSLAVITVSPVHARQILKALQNAKSSSVILQRFMNQNVAEPFQVVDISQTCGMRRDHVILSPGFGKTVHGRVLHSFGQLQESHGFLDLIDALEVARKSLTVVSALGVDDIDTGRLSTPGPKLLAQIIAEAGNARQDLVDYDHDTADPLLADFGDRLREQGFAVAYEYGFAGSRRLPMVVGMPDSRDAWEMAVLIDNADYVAEESLRRRDRFLPQAVADRGWLVFQTFSTSLFIDPAGQAAEVGAHLRASHSQKAEPELVPPILDGENWVEEPIFADVLERKTSRAAMGNPEMAIVGEDSTAQFAGPRERSARPKFTPGLQLSAYTDDQLDEVLAWIASDGIARTQAQFIQELRAELGIIRHGVQISTVLGNVVRRSGFVRLEDNE
ncbi:hypothetical protein [Arcanobacterium hippocoleae]|uniref:hypothetical protein n=1 Tax=Arcanobacterium hippocoleae TaxID=149017 RepID=UPI00333E34B5